MKVLIIGANGKIGRRLSKKLEAEEDVEPTAFIRKEEQQAYFEKLGVPVVVESLENGVEALKAAMNGYDAMVFTAGSGADTGYDKTMEVDLFGAIKAIESAGSQIKRFIMVSAAYSDQPSHWRDSMRPYYIAKHLADRELKRSGLDYTILRPVRLTDDEQAGKIMIKEDPQELKKEIPREAVAETIVHLLKNNSAIEKTLEMSEGEQDIESAIRVIDG